MAAVVALAFSIVAMGFGPAVAAGQETAGNATATERPTETATPTSTSSSPTEASDDQEGNVSGDRLDSSVILTDWSFSEGSFTLTFENVDRRPTTVTIAGATQPDEGVSRFNIREERLLPGTTTIQMRTHVSNGDAAVSITSAESTSNEDGIKVSTGNAGEDPFRHFGGTSGLLSGTFGTIGLSGLAAAWVLRQEESGVIRA